MSASLQGTMVDPEALAAEQQQLLQQQAEAARAQAQQALSQYQGAAQQPPPQLNPLDVFLPTLVGNIASTLSQNPTYREHGHEEVKRRQSELLKTRADTLQALQDNFKQKADAADAAGDLQAKEEALLAREKIHQKYQQVLDAQQQAAARELAASNRAAEHSNRLSEIAATAAQQRQTNAAKTGQDQQEQVDNEIKTSGGGQDYLPMTSFKGKEAMSLARTAAAQRGIPLVSEIDDDRLGKLKTARQNVRDMIAAAQQVSPRDWKEAMNPIAERGAAALKIQDLSGSNPSVTSFKNFYEGLIEQLVAVAGGRGSNVRVNQQELKGLMQRSPNVTTPVPVTLAWAKRIERLIDNAESPVLQRKGRPAATRPQVTAQPKLSEEDAYKAYLKIKAGK